jgi:peptidoglycan/xylan/chitin deacetylase (PgdA/CDA1 family)
MDVARLQKVFFGLLPMWALVTGSTPVGSGATWGSVAYAQGVVPSIEWETENSSFTIGADEMRLDGTVRSIDSRQWRFVLETDLVVLQPDGSGNWNDSPRRAIYLGRDALLWTEEGNSTPFRFAGLGVGDEVTVIGTIRGDRIFARMIAIQHAAPRRTAAPAKPKTPPGKTPAKSRRTSPRRRNSGRPRASQTPKPLPTLAPSTTPGSIARQPLPPTLPPKAPLPKPETPKPETPKALPPRGTLAQLPQPQKKPVPKPAAQQQQPRFAPRAPAPAASKESTFRIVTRPTLTAPDRLHTPFAGAVAAAPPATFPATQSTSRPAAPTRPPLTARQAPPSVSTPRLATSNITTPRVARATTTIAAPHPAPAAQLSAPSAQPRPTTLPRTSFLATSPPAVHSSTAPESTLMARTPLVPDASRATQPAAAPRQVLPAPQLNAAARANSTASRVARLPLKSAAVSNPLNERAVWPLGAQGAVQQTAQARWQALREQQAAITYTYFSGGDEQGEKVVALTFDDGPHPKNTPAVLDVLRREGVPATFFLVGRNVERHPQLVLRVLNEGHDVANHTYHHLQGVPLTLEQWKEEISRTNQALIDLVGEAPRWFRAPGCRYPAEALQALSELDMMRADTTNNSGDWSQPDADAVVRRVLGRLAPGQVLLFHDSAPQTAPAISKLIQEMRGRGYRFVTLTELAQRSQAAGFTPQWCPPGQGIVIAQAENSTRRP